jgi:hypothetical protein
MPQIMEMKILDTFVNNRLRRALRARSNIPGIMCFRYRPYVFAFGAFFRYRSP